MILGSREVFMIKYGKTWAEKFSSIENQKLTSNRSSTGLTVNSTNSRLSIGWALNKGRTGGVRFSENVRRYLTTRFEMEEGTGKKANPEEIERQMRNARNERNERLFQREEWLTKTQIMFFYFFTPRFTGENVRSGCYIKGTGI